MYFYFCSQYSSAIKINGMFYGTLSSSIKSLRIDEGNPLIEICPLIDKEPPVNFILDDNFLSNPPDSVCVTDLKGGYLIKFLKRFWVGDFQVLHQGKYSDCAATIFFENGLKISVETHNDFLAETLNLYSNSAETFRFELNNTPMLALLLKGENTTLLVYSLQPKIKKVLCREIQDFSIDNGLKTVELYNDIAKHKITTNWVFENDALCAKNTSVTVKDGFDSKLLNLKIIPYVFLEAFLLDADWKDYLCENALENCDKLKDFLGDFIGVLPPPTFRNVEQVGLLYKKGVNSYYVEYYIFETTNRKISNLKKCD